MIYEYKCTKCNLDFTEHRPMADRNKTIDCPACSSEAKRVLSKPLISPFEDGANGGGIR